MNRPIREGFQPDPAPAEPVATAPAAPPASPEPEEKWPIVIKLRHHGLRDPSVLDEIRELRLRQPTGGDINYCGSPILMGENGNFVIDYKRMHLMIARLAGILTMTLDQIDPRDWQSAAYRLFRFFLPSAAAWEP
jgi:hypothetical protein